MPRPSLKSERTALILDAYERCVARYGVEGSTLEKIAEEAGLARALIRHNIGNKDQLLDALIERFLTRSRSLTSQLLDSLPHEDRLATLIDVLFNENLSNAHDVRVASALILAANDRPKLASQLRRWNRDFTAAIEQELAKAGPKHADERIASIAAGIIGIYSNVEAVAGLGRMQSFRAASKSAALLLIDSLRSRT